VSASAGAAAFAAGARWLPVELLVQVPSEIPLEILGGVADEIIPRQGPMPAASEMGAVDSLRRRAAAEPDFAQRLRATLGSVDQRCAERLGVGFLAAASGERVQALAEFAAASAEAFAELRDAVYESYYTHHEVWRLIGYEFRSGSRPTAVLAPFDERSLARVRGMPARYRRAES